MLKEFKLIDFNLGWSLPPFITFQNWLEFKDDYYINNEKTTNLSYELIKLLYYKPSVSLCYMAIPLRKGDLKVAMTYFKNKYVANKIYKKYY